VKLYQLNWRLLLLGEHCYLDTGDECYFTDEYECRHRQGIKPQILSLKRGNMSAIPGMAEELALALPPEWAAGYTFVPMPPSSGAASPLRSLIRRLPVRDIRDLLVQVRDTPPSHDGWRPTPEQRVKLMTLNELEVDPEPRAVVIVDDVLATGSHFRAAKMLVRQRWPNMRVIGLFLARVCLRLKGSCYVDGAGEGNGCGCRLTQLGYVGNLAALV
jgi:predicted amidophosphoribosyltransferase